MNNVEDAVVIDDNNMELIKEAINKKKESERNGSHYRTVSFVSGDFKVEVKYELFNIADKTTPINSDNNTNKEIYVLSVRYIEVVRISELYNTPDKGFVDKNDFVNIVINDAGVDVVDFRVIKKAKKVYKNIIFKDT